jgi:hypothetical protein
MSSPAPLKHHSPEPVKTAPLLQTPLCDTHRMCLGTRLAHQHDLDETHPTQNKLHSPLQLVLMFD